MNLLCRMEYYGYFAAPKKRTTAIAMLLATKQLSTSFPAQGNVAGYNVGIRVDYANKRDLMNAQLDSAYTAFGLW